ncbi:hypothetical protein M5K25_022506 [Dendrobium thyrsiflorum]|uniref:Uncharacterized protein n=1 Tax=Dendrobium thyrsiflorum TaxID=117978 RepID=A0ABD0U6B5_DENTH
MTELSEQGDLADSFQAESYQGSGAEQGDLADSFQAESYQLCLLEGVMPKKKVRDFVRTCEGKTDKMQYQIVDCFEKAFWFSLSCFGR